ncbi:MAG: chorismate synthase [Bdellovibrionales bacterium]|nr:chorismate synthase [Bdellovibrionales bacterium]
MNANSFGQHFTITTFGESHGTGLGVVIDGCPAGVPFDEKLMLRELERRRPGSSEIVTSRNEQDLPQILSGVFEGVTLGTPIAIMVFNKDARSEDYKEIKKQPRKGHADDLWSSKFGNSDHRGGGRSSGRETVSRVMAGAVAKMVIRHLHPDLACYAYSAQIFGIALTPDEVTAIGSKTDIDSFPARFPHSEKSQEIYRLLKEAKEEGKSYGGTINLLIENVPANLGQPVFHKFKSDLAAALLSIGATTAVSIGEGFSSVSQEGVKFHSQDSNQYGGIRGGITTGEPVFAQIAFKPTSTVLDYAKKGRHDPCILPRAIPVVEAMANLVLVDHLLWMRKDRI